MTVRFSNDGDVLKSMNSGTLDLNKTIDEWVILCKKRSSIHQQRAVYLRIYTFVLTVLGLGAGGASSVVSTLMSQDVMSSHYAVWSASLSALALAMHAINNIIDPGVLRLNHLTANRDYDLLARDIELWCKANKYIGDYNTVRIECMRFQRRIDNIQTVAPAL